MTAATLTLAEFLLARIAEKEATAINVTRFEVRDGIPGNYVIKDEVLAECEAKRRIVAEHAPIEWDTLTWCRMCVRPQGFNHEGDGESHGRSLGIHFPCPTIRALALPYADHPDYREEWRP